MQSIGKSELANPEERATAVRSPALRAAAVAALARLRADAARPPCVVLLGESNSGKTTAANQLLGAGPLPTSVIRNTEFPTLLRHSSETEVHAHISGGLRIKLTESSDLSSFRIEFVEVGVPNSRLEQVEVLDTPAGVTLQKLSEFPGLASLLIPIWCTPATQAWKGTERLVWSRIDPRFRSRGILAVTGLDRIRDDEARLRLHARLAVEAGPYFKEIAFTPVLPVNGRQLGEAVLQLAARLWQRRQRTIERLCRRLVRLTDEAVAREASPGVNLVDFRRGHGT